MDDAAVDDAATTSDLCSPPPTGTQAAVITGVGRFRSVAPLTFDGLLPRGLRVFLPADYDDDPDHRYPVLYMHDGQNLFQPFDAAFGVEWQVDEVIDALVQIGVVEPHIVVGIDNTSERIDDYTPTFDVVAGGGGKADLYADFLVDVVKPTIESAFRVRCGPGDTALAGSSLGGIASLHVAMVKPGAFDRIGAVSTSFWWDSGYIVPAIEGWSGALPERIWLDMGSLEGEEPPPGEWTLRFAQTRAARDALLAKGFDFGDTLGALEDVGAAHDEASWAARLPSILAFLLSDTRPVDLPVAALGLATPSDTLSTGGGPIPSVTSLSIEANHGDLVRLTWPNAALELTAEPAGVVTLSDAGEISALAPGTATVTAAGLDTSGSITLTVVEGADVEGVDVEFVVTVPASTPEGSSVHISGSVTALGQWDGVGVALAPLGGSMWTATVTLSPGEHVEFKVTRGSWATVEKGPAGEEIANREFTVEPDLVIEATVASWADVE